MLPHSLQLRVPILMGNAIWFILLVGLSLLLLIYTFWRNRDIKLLVLFLGLGAIAVFLENVIFIWHQSYEYYPGILENVYYDMVLGAYLSQVYYVSSVALFIAAFNLRFRWILFFVAMFVGIEFLFLSLGIYKLNWWHSSYTAVGLFIYFWTSKKWCKSIIQFSSSSRFIRWFTLFCSSYNIYVMLVSIPLFLGHYHFVGGWFVDTARDTVAVLIVIRLIKSAAITIVCYYRLHRIIMVLLPIMMWASYLILIHLNMMSFKHFGDLLFFAATDILVLLCCYYFDKVLSKEQ